VDILIAAACLIAWIGVAVAQAQEEAATPANVISVTAVGEAKGTPDVLKVNLMVSTTTPLAADALAQNTKKVSDLMAQLATVGVAKEAVESGGQTVSPAREGYSGPGSSASGFTASETLTITIKGDAVKNGPDRIGTILDAGSKIGAVSAVPDYSARYGEGGPAMASYTVSDPDALRAAALQQAVGRARSLAEKAAAVMGVRLGDLRSVTIPREDSSRYYGGGMTEAEITSSSPTTISVSVAATVQYEFTK